VHVLSSGSQYQTATLHDLNDTPTDMNTGITEETAFPAPSRSNFQQQASIVEKYEADLRASLPTTTPDSQEDPKLNDSLTPIKRILQDAFGYSDGTSAIVDASQNKPG
jgi:hypothetical protein